MRRIAIDCLSCGHRTSVPEEKLPYFELEPDSSLVLLTERLVCVECGGRSVSTYRYEDESPPLAPK